MRTIITTAIIAVILGALSAPISDMWGGVPPQNEISQGAIDSLLAEARQGTANLNKQRFPMRCIARDHFAKTPVRAAAELLDSTLTMGWRVD